MAISFTFPEKLALVWFFIDAFTHLTIEAGYVYLALTETALKSDSKMGDIWRQYSRADARWQIRDANVISLELMTVVVMGPMALYQMYLIYAAKNPKNMRNRGTLIGCRHALQIVICSCELYGGWMTFCPEWVDGSPNLNGTDPILLWVRRVALCRYDSYISILLDKYYLTILFCNFIVLPVIMIFVDDDLVLLLTLKYNLIYRFTWYL